MIMIMLVDRPVSNHCPAFRTHQSDVRCAELAVGHNGEGYESISHVKIKMFI